MCRADRASVIGARGGTRTPDAHLRTVALYPLSYTGTSNENDVEHHASTGHAGRRTDSFLNVRAMSAHSVRTPFTTISLLATTWSKSELKA